ncbi:hypothetical protein E2C00_00735 [Streptomyces sp. WAC05374]|uniref:hypothetical protein n=1 Tax=Streptomyces sp. WAC05374 TaxID=2487420 RepID=UPI000F88B4AC|nr:hypothetical protein [Streptomyces sp. WAC05374]RST19578.1 hypothetical protein EF905_00210 [Streptomyces sp. WAC05374]TDF50085.1 hypothetical protein E2B92_00710 [Streptomyces sp. WAC05374]TDF57811.1 hypothetical protein E2C02_08500 [Streptomyces sp. WAC05374]TDF60339.1 hypothetical protein E2C00_00735 [Streptomyces sp. WAC05374]
MVSSVLPELWLRGVAANPAASSEVLLRLLAVQARGAWTVLCQERRLPEDVIEAVVAHPDPAVRRSFARNCCATPEQRGRLVNDSDALVRAAVALGPRPGVGRVEALPDDVLETILTVQDDNTRDQLLTASEIRQELEFSGQISPSFRRRMHDHENPELRSQAAGLWLWLTPAQRQALLADPVPSVRESARDHSRILDPAAMEADLPQRDCHHRSLLLVNYAVSRTVAEQCLADRRDLWALAHNPHTPSDVVARLARDSDPHVRERIAARADLDPGLLAELAQDPDDSVRTRALLQPLPRAWSERNAIDRVIGCAAERIGPVGEMLIEPETGWYASCAASTHPLLRRVAATCPRLPEELVHHLAEDPDPDVRHLLAYNHPLAPPDVILDAFIATPRQRPYLLTLPRLPRSGLHHLLDHHDPDVRALAATDTSLDQPPVRLLADSDSRVRRAAAANPLLPVDLISSLLNAPEHAEGAAANPSLPPERLHELLDLSGLPPVAPG